MTLEAANLFPDQLRKWLRAGVMNDGLEMAKSRFDASKSFEKYGHTVMPQDKRGVRSISEVKFEENGLSDTYRSRTPGGR
jgi:hypothetical protein